MEIKYGYIYRALFSNNKSYIGYAIDIEKRKNEHKRHSFNKNSKEYEYTFHRAIRKYGWDSIYWHILENKIAINKLPKIEIFYISKFNTYSCGYNETKGGDGWLGKTHTAAAKEKMSKSKKGKSYHTPESRAKISAFFKGRKCTEEHKRKVALSKMGNKNPMINSEYRRRLSEAKKGCTISKETRIKISNSLKNRVISKETREKMSKAGKGKVISKETRDKISISLKGKIPWNKDKVNIYSKKTLLAMSLSSKGKIVSEKTKQKISKSNKGNTHSEETKIKMSQNAVKRKRNNKGHFVKS